VDWNWTEARALLEQGLSVAPGNDINIFQIIETACWISSFANGCQKRFGLEIR